jgi:hypothetical protein
MAMPRWGSTSRGWTKKADEPIAAPKGRDSLSLADFCLQIDATSEGTAGALLSPPGRRALRAASDPAAASVSAGERARVHPGRSGRAKPNGEDHAPLWQYFSQVARQTRPLLPPKGANHCPLRVLPASGTLPKGQRSGRWGHYCPSRRRVLSRSLGPRRTPAAPAAGSRDFRGGEWPR